MFKSPISDVQQLMAITSEECGELVQACMKVMRTYEEGKQIDEKWRKALIEEAGDVYCMLGLLISKGVISSGEVKERALLKQAKLKKWSTLINE